MDPNDYWFHWYPNIFRKATRHLTTFQRGIYRELIDEYMETREPLPASDIALANIAGITLEEWNENKKPILMFFDEENENFCHDFCDEILNTQDKRAKKRSKASKKAALTRWKHKQNRKMRNECEVDAIAMRSDARGEERRGVKKNKQKKENRFEEFWEQFPRQRRGSKQKAQSAYDNAIERDTEDNIIDGVLRYAASDEVARGYAKGAQAWLNDDRWTSDYSIKPQSRMPNGQPDYFDGMMEAGKRASKNVEGM